MNTFAPAAELQALEKLRDEELEEARALQSVVLPTESLCSRGVTISHQFQPVSAVGGDFLDYFELTDGSIGLYLGDVSGKGLPAAFFGALAVGTLRGVHKNGNLRRSSSCHIEQAADDPRPPGAACRSAVCGVQSRHSRDTNFERWNARTAASLRQGCPLLKLSGIPPGLWPCASYEATVLRREPGDSVLFCTDGVTDSMNGDEESFGTDRLVAICDGTLLTRPRTFSKLSSRRSSASAGDMARTTTWRQPCSTARSDVPLKSCGTRAYERLTSRLSTSGCPNSNVCLRKPLRVSN